MNITLEDQTLSRNELQNINPILDSILPNIEDSEFKTTLEGLRKIQPSTSNIGIISIGSIIALLIVCYFLGILPFQKSFSKQSGGTESTLHVELKPDANAKKMLEDHLFCFHPLVPIYILLTSFYNQLGSELEEDPFLASYISYFNVLEKMTHSLIENYLKSEDVSKIMEAFIIGSSLQTTFFTSKNCLSDIKTGLPSAPNL